MAKDLGFEREIYVVPTTILRYGYRSKAHPAMPRGAAQPRDVIGRHTVDIIHHSGMTFLPQEL